MKVSAPPLRSPTIASTKPPRQLIWVVLSWTHSPLADTGAVMPSGETRVRRPVMPRYALILVGNAVPSIVKTVRLSAAAVAPPALAVASEVVVAAFPANALAGTSAAVASATANPAQPSL